MYKRKILEMDELQVYTYINWKYEYPYEFYNIPEEGVKETIDEIFEDNNSFYFSVFDSNGKLFGIYEYTFRSNFMEIGLGIRPEDTGKGLGLDFIRECIHFGRTTFLYRGDICLRVADFNKRAIKLYKKIGFIEFSREENISFGKPVVFICMKLLNNSSYLTDSLEIEYAHLNWFNSSSIYYY